MGILFPLLLLPSLPPLNFKFIFSSSDVPYSRKVWRGESLVNHQWFAKLKPSKLVVIIITLWLNPFIRQTFSYQTLKKGRCAKVSPHQTFPLYSIKGYSYQFDFMLQRQLNVKTCFRFHIMVMACVYGLQWLHGITILTTESLCTAGYNYRKW